MKYNRVHLGFDPSVAPLLGHNPTPRPTCPAGFDITHYLLVIAWHFKDILRFVSKICIGNTHCLEQFYFTHNEARTVIVFSYG